MTNATLPDLRAAAARARRRIERPSRWPLVVFVAVVILLIAGGVML